MSTFKVNDNFIFSSKDGKVSFTSVLPDMSEIYVFEGMAGTVLADWYTSKKVSTDKAGWEKKLSISISEDDWKNFLSFASDKQLILEV